MAYIDAISAMEITTVNMPQATPKNTQTAPAGPPFRRASVPVLIRLVNLTCSCSCGAEESLHKGKRPCQAYNRRVANQRYS